MLVCQEEAQGVIDAIMAFAIVNIALTATLLVGFPGKKRPGWLYPPCCSKIESGGWAPRKIKQQFFIKKQNKTSLAPPERVEKA